jgi:hypothetical protein
MTGKPEKTFRAGACSASVFMNERQTDKGTVSLPSIAFSCRYRDEATGVWKDTSSMSPNEAARALIVIQKALEHCLLRETEPAEVSTGQ